MQVEAEKGGRTEQPLARGWARTWEAEEDEAQQVWMTPHNLHKHWAPFCCSGVLTCVFTLHRGRMERTVGHNHSTAIAQLQLEKPFLPVPNSAFALFHIWKAAFRSQFGASLRAPEHSALLVRACGKPLPENPSQSPAVTLLWPCQPGPVPARSLWPSQEVTQQPVANSDQDAQQGEPWKQCCVPARTWKTHQCLWITFYI